jgi:23S rRNA (guanosine2251-2'-O)-methyltransferase
MTAARELVYGRRPVREVVRAGRRQVLELLASERALAAEAWLREVRGPRVQVRPESALTAEAGSRDHQGVVAWCEPYRYGDAYELAARERPLIVCLDQITDPQNLGAVCRSAEGAGVTAVVVPEHNAARVTAAVSHASAGAVEHVPVAVVVNLARYISEVKGADLWAWAADGNAEETVWSTDLAGGSLLVFGSEGRGIRPGVRKVCDGAFSIPLAGMVESLNVSVAAGIALFEAARQRRAAREGDPRLAAEPPS